MAAEDFQEASRDIRATSRQPLGGSGKYGEWVAMFASLPGAMNGIQMLCIPAWKACDKKPG